MEKRKAVLLIGGDDLDTATNRCIKHCEDYNLKVVSVVYESESNPSKWRDAYAALASGEADVLVHHGWDDIHVHAAGQIVRRTPNSGPTAGQRRARRI